MFSIVYHVYVQYVHACVICMYVPVQVELIWAKRLQQWKTEKAARKKLLQDVIDTRKKQIEEKCMYRLNHANTHAHINTPGMRYTYVLTILPIILFFYVLICVLLLATNLRTYLHTYVYQSQHCLRNLKPTTYSS